jgi:hypothetical protein
VNLKCVEMKTFETEGLQRYEYSFKETHINNEVFAAHLRFVFKKPQVFALGEWYPVDVIVDHCYEEPRNK